MINRPHVVMFMLVLGLAALAQAQTFTTLYNFTGGSDGDNPYGALVQDANGNFFGTTSSEFGSGYGTAFEITAGGALTTLYTFCSLSNCADGSYPVSGLTLADDGNFYGVTNSGGTHNDGTFFKMTPQGTLTTLYSFCSQANCTDGTFPATGLLQGANGKFYGTTGYGGTTGFGTVFEVTRAGVLTTLYNFCSQSNCTDGALPLGSLVRAKDGYFYGTTAAGGAYGPYENGTVYRLTRHGKLTTLYSFCSQKNCADGRFPNSGLLLGRNGKFYGTTSFGGRFLKRCNNGTGCGTVFEITAGGTLTTLHYFCLKTNCPDGDRPLSALIQARNGKLYGSTPYGGKNGYGTIFAFTLAGKLTTIHHFAYADGSEPVSALLQAADGSFYGTTLEGGSGGSGTVFHISAK